MRKKRYRKCSHCTVSVVTGNRCDECAKIPFGQKVFNAKEKPKRAKPPRFGSAAATPRSYERTYGSPTPGMSVAYAARLLKVTTWTIYMKITRGDLKRFYFHSRPRITEKSVQDYLLRESR